jgi:predicted esterase
MLTQLQVGEEDVRRIAVPLLAKNVPSDVRTAAVGAIGRKEFPWAVDLLIDALKMTAGESGRTVRPDLWGIAGTLAGLDDPKAIPVMIAVIDDDNTYNTVYGVGYFGLGRLTGVKYDDAHDGAWWRKWWENNREKYPAPVRDMAIPELSSRASALASHDNRAGNSADDADALADVKDVPAQDLRIGGDGKKRYFLIGKVEQVDSPADPTGLVVVLPGGDGSADFHPFIRRISKNVLPTGWLIAQAVAPQWDKKQPELVVWPTEKLPYPGAKFTTEEFIEGIIADVRAKAKVDSRRIFLLGWSSGGPPCYAAALRKETPVTGAFIAMSVFKPQLMPAIDHAKDRAFYLLQSPDDQVTPIRFAVDAEKALDAAGAKVRLRRYDGGHGWQGDVWKMIGEGIQWLEKPVADGTVTSLSPLSDPGLEVADVGTPTEKSGWMFMATPGEAGYRIASETDQVIAGKRCARLEQEGKFEGIGFGNLMQVIDAAPYRGKRVRFRAAVRSQVEGAGNQAMLWMRVDRTGQNGKEESGFFDNMHERPIKAKEWQHYDIVGDVADDARLVNLGMVLVGSGKAWLDDASLEVVGADVPLTGPEQVKQKAKEALADKSSSNILLNPSFEDGDKSPAEWSQGADIDGVEYSWDKNAGQKGKASLCLNKTAKRYFPIAQWSQIVERKTDRPSLQVSAQVKAEGVTKATIDVIFLDENGKSISHEWAAYIGAKEAKDPPADHDWKEYVSKVKIPKRTRKLQICLQISGPGKVWFDEIRAEYVE